MGRLLKVPGHEFGHNFIPQEFLTNGADEYTVRNEQVQSLLDCDWRNLKKDEIKILKKHGNYSCQWDNVLVCDPFNPNLIINSFFAGLVRIGCLEEGFLQHHDLTVPIGIRNSRIISCDIGANCAIQDCSHISHSIICDMVLLHRIDEISTSNRAKFGEGILKDGESEKNRIWIDPVNEAGGRSFLPFNDLICADAFLWSMYKDDAKLQSRLKNITQQSADTRRGYYSVIGKGSVIKGCRFIKDVRIGEYCYIKGANKLKNLTIKSNEEETTQIGEGVELVNGIIGYRCQVFYGVKAVRFVLGNNSNLKYGARLIHSVLGDNSTVSCCELLNNLIFPGHEQHHNNSFLIASLVKGQSNMAAGATLGSNHNSRGNNGELIAGRGFWPGLSCTVKHNSRFASYTLLAKGIFSHEIDLPFPFAMLSDEVKKDELVIMPAYFWMYNMYALERNSWKYKVRDRRKIKVQHMESDYLAPDTAEEILHAINLLETQTDFKSRIENSNREVRIIKKDEALVAYRQMLTYYGVKAIAMYLKESKLDYEGFLAQVPESISLKWVNMGGQLVPEYQVDRLRAGIREGFYTNWKEIHGLYEQWWKDYPRQKVENAYEVLRQLQGVRQISKKEFLVLVKSARLIREDIQDQIWTTKQKDYDNPYRLITYRNKAERDAVIGKIEDDPFIKESQAETEEFFKILDLID